MGKSPVSVPKETHSFGRSSLSREKEIAFSVKPKNHTLVIAMQVRFTVPQGMDNIDIAIYTLHTSLAEAFRTL